MTRLKRAAQLAQYLATPKDSAAYVGFVGYQNLGDEVLWHDIRSAFEPMRVALSPWPISGASKKLAESRRHRVAILGGGTLIGANLPDGSNPFRDHFSSVARRSDHSIVFGTGVGALSDDASANAWLNDWRGLLERCAYIGVRGPESVQSLERIGIKAELLGDPACLSAKPAGFWQPRNDMTLGVNLGRSPVRSAGVEETLINDTAKLIAQRIKAGWTVELFIVLPSDYEIAQEVLGRLDVPAPVVHRCYDDGEAYLNAVRQMTAFIGVKLHSVILAMAAGVPSVMIEYAPKCRDFMSSMGVERHSVHISEASSDNLAARLEDLLSVRAEVGVHISRKMNEVRTRLLEKAAQLRAQLR